MFELFANMMEYRLFGGELDLILLEGKAFPERMQCVNGKQSYIILGKHRKFLHKSI